MYWNLPFLFVFFFRQDKMLVGRGVWDMKIVSVFRIMLCVFPFYTPLCRLYNAVKIISSFNEISSIRVNDFSEKIPFLQHLIFVKIYYSSFFSIKFSCGLFFHLWRYINKTTERQRSKKKWTTKKKEPKLRSVKSFYVAMVR